MKTQHYLFLCKKLLLLALVFCLCTFYGCGTAPNKHEFDPQDKGNELSQTKNLLLYDDDNISVQYVTGELIRKHRPTKIINISPELSKNNAVLVMVTIKSKINCLSVYELHWTNGDFKSGDILYTVEQSSSDDKLFWQINFSGDMAFKGLSYVDIDGNVKNIFMHKSDINGKLFISKY